MTDDDSDLLDSINLLNRKRRQNPFISLFVQQALGSSSHNHLAEVTE